MKYPTFPVLLAFAALAACAGSPDPVRGVSTPTPPAAAPREPFADKLQDALKKFAPAPREDDRESDAVGQLRRAEQRERELIGKLRSSYDQGRDLPVDLVAELRQVRDELYEARWRLLVENPGQPLPATMVRTGGAS